MEQKTLTGEVRNELKKGACRRLRQAGKIPSIMYGHKDKEPMAIAVNEHEFRTKFKVISENVIIKLTVGNESYDVLVKDFQEDLIKDRISHIDFYEVEAGKTLKTHVPIHITGTAKGVKVGGLFEALMHELEIECFPRDLPESVTVNIDDMGVGASVHISDLDLGEGIKLLTPENQVICHVIKKRDTIDAPEDEEAGE